MEARLLLAQPNPSRSLLGLFYISWPLPEVGSTHEKSKSGNFVLYILYPTHCPHLPPGCTKGQSKGRKHWDSFLEGEGREGKLRPGSMYNWYYSFSQYHHLLTTSLMNTCFSILCHLAFRLVAWWKDTWPWNEREQNSPFIVREWLGKDNCRILLLPRRWEKAFSSRSMCIEWGLAEGDGVEEQLIDFLKGLLTL